MRKLARENGIRTIRCAASPRPGGELEARQSVWREAARAIGELGTGLDDAEYIGSVLWTARTNKGAEGNPEEQKRVIVDRLALGDAGQRGHRHSCRRGPLRPGGVPAKPVAAAPGASEHRSSAMPSGVNSSRCLESIPGYGPGPPPRFSMSRCRFAAETGGLKTQHAPARNPGSEHPPGRAATRPEARTDADIPACGCVARDSGGLAAPGPQRGRPHGTSSGRLGTRVAAEPPGRFASRPGLFSLGDD